MKMIIIIIQYFNNTPCHYAGSISCFHCVKQVANVPFLGHVRSTIFGSGPEIAALLLFDQTRIIYMRGTTKGEKHEPMSSFQIL